MAEPISVFDYENFVRDVAFMGLKDDAYNVIGLCGEAGEVAEWVKKCVLRAKPTDLTENDLLQELGDVQHYIARLAINHGWTILDVMQANHDKLVIRYGKA